MLLKECNKIIANRYILTFLLFLCLCNAFLLFNQVRSDNENFAPQKYKQVYQQIEEKTPNEALDTISTEYNRLQGYEYLYLGEVDENIFSSLGLKTETLLADYQQSTYYGDYSALSDDLALYRAIKEELLFLTDYDLYLENIDIKATQMTQTNLFAEQNTFSYLNIKKTPTDFSKLKSLPLTVSSSLGIRTATNFPATDVIAVLIALTIIMLLVSREKEQSILILMHTTPNGRVKLGLVKLSACLFFSSMAITVLYSINLVIAGYLYGLGDLSRYIQSVASMNGSCLKITVSTYLILFYFSKLLAIGVVTTILFIISVLAKSTAQCFGLTAAVACLFFVFFHFLPTDAYISIFKYVNPIAYFQTFDLYAIYQNRNIFGHPISALLVFFVTSAALFVLISIVSIYLYGNMNIVQASNKNTLTFRLLRCNHTNLFVYECYKTLISSKIILVLIGFIVIRITCYKPLTIYQTPDEIYYNQYIASIIGKFTEDKETYIIHEQQRFNDLQNEFITSLQETNGNQLLLILKYQELLAPKNAVDKLAEHTSYLKQKPNSQYLDDRGFIILTGGDQSNLTPLYLALIMTAFIIACMSEMFGIEYRTQMNNLIQATVFGRKRYLYYKLIIAFMLVIVLYIATYVPYFYQIISAYGSAGINAPAYSMEHLPNTSMSIRYYLILKNLIRFIGYTCQVILIYIFSKKIHNNVIVIVVSCFILILPLILMLFGVEGSQYILLNPIIADF